MSSFNDRVIRQARYVLIIATTIILVISIGTTSVSARRILTQNFRKAATTITTVISSLYTESSSADQKSNSSMGDVTSVITTASSSSNKETTRKTRPITETFAPISENTTAQLEEMSAEETVKTSVPTSDTSNEIKPTTGTLEQAVESAVSHSSSAESDETTESTSLTSKVARTESETSATTSNNTTKLTTATTTTKATTTATTTTQPTTIATTTTQPTTTATTTTQPTTAITEASPDEENHLYVSATGSNSGAGTESSPYKTIQYAIDRAQPDVIIVVRAGVYNEKLKISGKTGLTIQNYPGERPALTGTGYSSGYLVDITGSSNIVFTGFEIYDFKGANLECIMIRQASRDIEISYCKIHDVGTTLAKGNAHVILASGDSNTALKNIVIKNNEIFNCKTGWSESVTMEGNVDGFKILNNKIYDVTNIAIDATGFYDSGCTIASMNQARNGLISGNLVYNVYCSYATAAGIYVDGGKNIIIEKNIVHNSMSGIEIGCEKPYDEVNTSVKAVVSGIIVRNNILYNNTEIGISIGGYDGNRTGQVINSQIYNNTLYKNQDELILGTCDNITLTNNIFYGNGKASMLYNDPINMVTNLHMDGNIYYTENGSIWFELNGKGASSLSDWQTLSGQDLNSVYTDPMFVSAGSFNFNLQASSPAIGSGAK